MRIDPERFAALPQDQQEALLAELEEYERVSVANPLVKYRPHPKQAQLHSSHKALRLFAGGNQSGKTTAGIADDLIQLCDEEALPPHLRQYKKWTPPFKMRVVTPDLMGTMTLFLEKMRDLVPREQLLGGDWDTAYKKKDRVLRFKNGSFVEFLSSDQDRDKHGGSTLHRVHYDEEPSLEIRNECKMRLVRHGGDELFTMTPSLPGTEGWTQDAIWERRLEDGIFAVQVSIHDNPYLTKAAVAQALDGYSDAELQAREEGRFLHYAGMVYSDFKDAIHLRSEISPEELKEAGGTNYVSIDPGNRWTAVVYGNFNADNDLLIFDVLIFAKAQDASKLCTVLPDGVTVEAVADAIKERNAQWGIKPLYTMDPAAKNNLMTGENIEAEFNRQGIYLSRANNNVQYGIDQIHRRLQRKTAEGEPRPALKITRNCKRLIWEIGRYRIKETADQSFAVVKQDDHAVDAMRYMACERAWIAAGDKKPKSGFWGWKDGVFHLPPDGFRPKRRLTEYGPSGSWS